MAKAIKAKSSNSLLQALDFVEPATKADGTPTQTHVVLHNNQCTAYDGIIAMGHPIEESIGTCPHFASLRAALKRTKDSVSLTQKDNGDLSIRSGKLSATIKATQYHNMMITRPDGPMYELVDDIRPALAIAEKVMKDDENNLVTSSILIATGKIVVTDGVLMLEFAHRNIMPTLTLPKDFVGILAKSKLAFVGFGFTETTVTFYAANGAWIKSSLRSLTWPDMSAILDAPMPALAAPPNGLTDAIEAVAPHSLDGALHVTPAALRSHALDQGDAGASYDLDCGAVSGIFSVTGLTMVAKLAKWIQFDLPLRTHKMIGFVGDGVRGYLMSRSR